MFCTGMVGNYNGDQTDDVVYRDGTMVPISEFSFRLLHQVGLSCELLTRMSIVLLHADASIRVDLITNYSTVIVCVYRATECFGVSLHLP